MNLHKLNPAERTELERACSWLFPDDPHTIGFIATLDLDKVKRAFRKRAKLLHPDASSSSNGVSRLVKERFMSLHTSYKLMASYMQDTPQMTFPYLKDGLQPLRKGRVIAVGGAKGGIGKSIIASNLAVFLSGRGLRTVVVDLDLGGANQHLYLGERSILRHNINDFIHKRVDGLEEAIIQCKYGPKLLGGDSSELGIANLAHAKKIRLLKAIRNLDADFIILDLGGDTTYNILDFFLAADYGIVVTTRDSASYIGAYHFIKAALYRRLLRIFSPESKYASRRDPETEHAITSLLSSPEGEPSSKSIPEFLDRLREINPASADIAAEAIRDFSPCLIVNKVPAGFPPAQVIEKLQGVIRRYLNKDIVCLGAIPFQPEVEQSVIELVPVVSRHPDGVMAKGIAEILRNLSVE